jgi:hypothetical protein
MQNFLNIFTSYTIKRSEYNNNNVTFFLSSVTFNSKYYQNLVINIEISQNIIYIKHKGKILHTIFPPSSLPVTEDVDMFHYYEPYVPY